MNVPAMLPALKIGPLTVYVHCECGAEETFTGDGRKVDHDYAKWRAVHLDACPRGKR